MDSLDRLFDILSRERRRYALYALDRADGPVSIETLAEQIRQWEGDGTGVDAEAYDDVVLSLRHSHLPKASRAEYVEYDRDAGEVRISGDPAELEIILTVSRAVERPASEDRSGLDSVTPQEFLAQLTATGRRGD